MSGSDHEAEYEARKVRRLRLDTVRDIRALQAELAVLHDALLACEDTDKARAQDLLHAAGVMTGVWLDDVACRFADAEHEADELFAKAWELLEDLPVEPAGFLSREDAALLNSLRGSTAAILARLWITGYLVGPIPEEAWPNAELAALLLAALEHHADAVALAEALDHGAQSHEATDTAVDLDDDPEEGIGGS